MSKVEEKPDKSQKKISKNEDEQEVTYLIYSIFAYFTILVIIGLPIWWYTTRVYRASLPINEMYNVELSDRMDKEFGIPLSLDYDILITIVNPEPSVLKVELKGQELEDYLQPFINKLSPLANFTIKSQWLYLVELGAIPLKVHEHYALRENQLPHIISPLEKKMWSHLSPRPALNLVLYFAHCRAPLYIYNSKNEKIISNAMLSPRWGGIHIINSDKESCAKGHFKPNLESITSTMITLLQRLFKIDSIKENNIYKLKMEKAQEMLDSSRRTLKSLATLLSQISSIVISDEVADKINVAVENADLTEKYIKNNDVDQALKYAKVAYANSEAAFSDPSLLALLYFPDDQKYAVYIPLFLPIMIPVFMSLKVIPKWYFKKEN